MPSAIVSLAIISKLLLINCAPRYVKALHDGFLKHIVVKLIGAAVLWDNNNDTAFGKKVRAQNSEVNELRFLGFTDKKNTSNI